MHGDPDQVEVLARNGPDHGAVVAVVAVVNMSAVNTATGSARPTARVLAARSASRSPVSTSTGWPNVARYPRAVGVGVGLAEDLRHRGGHRRGHRTR